MTGVLLSLAFLGTAHAAEDAPSPLVPELELENYTKHPVDAEGMVYKPGKGLVVSSDDGMFSMAIGLRAMFLYEVANDPEVDPGEDTTTQELMIRRARVTFGGHMWGKHNKYKVELAISPKDESVDDTGYVRQTPLLSWEQHFTQLRDLSVRIGQYKINYSRERVISSSKLELVDRSLANKAFNLDRDIGLELYSKDLGGGGLLQYTLGAYAGEGRGRFEPSDFGMMYLARVNLTPMGTFNDFESQDFDRGAPRLSLGAAYAYVDQANGSKSILDGGPADAIYSYHNATVDTMFKASGFSTQAAFFWRDGGDQFSAFAETGMGFYVQPGLLVPHQPVGIAVRYTQVMPEEGGALSEVHEVGPGLSWYLSGARNKFKLQTDYLRIWGDDFATAEDVARLQLQAML